jgi:hypothetical protein
MEGGLTIKNGFLNPLKALPDIGLKIDINYI